MKKSILLHLIEISLPVIIITTLCGCDSMLQTKSSTKNGMYFDTIVSVTIYDNDTEKAEILLDESMKICEKFENLFSKNIPDSDIYKINTAANSPVEINVDTSYLLEKGLYYTQISDGKFNITIAPLTQLWDFHGEANAIPQDNEITQALSHIDHGMKNHILNIDSRNNTATLSDDKSSIEIGGIAKGYIADKIYEYLADQDIAGAIINMGGDIKVLGQNQNNESFTIGINDPNNSGTPLFPIYLKNISVATSGTYERYFMDENGKKYHHILDPETGYPVNTDILQATVITTDSVDADALATICILKGSRDAVNFIEDIPDTECILITNSGDIIKSNGADKFISKSR